MRTVGWKFATSGVSKCSPLLAGPSLLLSQEILAAEDELKSAVVAGSKGHSTSTTNRLGCLRKCQFAALFCNLSERQSSHSALISQAFSSFSFFFCWMKVNLNGHEARSSFRNGPFRRVNLIQAQIACSASLLIEILSGEQRVVMLDKSANLCSVTGPQHDISQLLGSPRQMKVDSTCLACIRLSTYLDSRALLLCRSYCRFHRSA